MAKKIPKRTSYSAYKILRTGNRATRVTPATATMADNGRVSRGRMDNSATRMCAH